VGIFLVCGGAERNGGCGSVSWDCIKIKVREVVGV